MQIPRHMDMEVHTRIRLPPCVSYVQPNPCARLNHVHINAHAFGSFGPRVELATRTQENGLNVLVLCG